MKNRINNMMKKFNDMNSKKKLVISVGTLILVALAFIISTTLAALEPVKSVIITSSNTNYEEKESGSWQITKSAKWTKKGTAEITFDVDTVLKTSNKYTDILFVLDISGSMEGEKLERVKSDATGLINTLLSDDKNRAGLITFESSSQVVSEFTNDKDSLIETINNLLTGDMTNYYQALVNVDTILKNYVKEDDRDCVVLFLTDGYPNENIPNEEAQYRYLKDAYPFITINGVQYEMGEDILEPIKKVSDNQYIADMETLNNVLFDASVAPAIYENFEITDFIDTNYFIVDNEDDIKVSEGKVVLDKEKQTVSWKIDSLKSGSKVAMTINAKLKDELIGKGGVYPTNEKEIIQSKIDDQLEEETSTKTPVLADNYKVIYEGNAPENCKMSGVIPNEETRSVFNVVGISEKVPKCEGYEFKGWKIINKNIERVNDDYFIMPEEDIVIKGTWGRVKLEKSMEGEVYVAQTFYKMMKALAALDDEKSTYVSGSTGIDFGKAPSNTNGKGVYLRAPTKDDEYPVLYYRGEVNDNNVKFANFCWKIVRTTETGGVKLIYNGEPDVDGNCTNTTGETTQIGTSKFNQYDSSPADVGYMYGNRNDYTSSGGRLPNIWYEYIGKRSSFQDVLSMSNVGLGNAYYYSDSIEWDNENSQYILKNSNGSEVSMTEWGRETYAGLKGKYRCSQGTSTSCATVYYITDTSYYDIFYMSLSNNQTLDDVNKVWNYGSEVVYEDGAYTIKNPKEIQTINWYAKHDSLKGNYVCFDGKTSCVNVWYIVNFANSGSAIEYVTMENGETYDSLYEEGLNKKWIYGNDVEWDGNKYTLVDTYASSPINWSNDYKTIATKYHYSCFSTGKSCSKVGYILYFENSESYVNFLTLKGGKKLEDAKSEMFSNINDSKIKQTIDTWYQAHMLDYTERLEDTVWCNDRSIDRGFLKSKDEDSSITSGNNRANATFFGADGRNVRTYNPSVECINANDRFTVSVENGNGKLIYPVALLTADELTLAGHGNTGYSSMSYLYTSMQNWSLSPYVFIDNTAGGFQLRSGGNLYVNNASYSCGVRPAISLAPGTIIAGGDGSSENPFTLLTD